MGVTSNFMAADSRPVATTLGEYKANCQAIPWPTMLEKQSYSGCVQTVLQKKK
jgi:hypothetical protein